MEQKSCVTFQIYHDEETPVSMYPGLLLFFGLNGNSMLDTADTNYVLQENEIYIASPLTLYRVRCKEGAALLSMAIKPEIVREAGWEDKITADCLLPAAQADAAAHYAVRQRMAARFRSLFQAGASSRETDQQAIKLVSAVRESFTKLDRKHSAPSAEIMTRIEQILRYVQTRWNEPITLAQVAAEHSIDRTRVYATGHSHGSVMTQVLAMAMTDVFAAATPCSGILFRMPDMNIRALPEIAQREDVQIPIWMFGGEQEPWLLPTVPDNKNETGDSIRICRGINHLEPALPQDWSKGWTTDGRWHDLSYARADGAPMVRYTWVDYMPHATMTEMSFRIGEEFFYKFQRRADGTVVYHS